MPAGRLYYCDGRHKLCFCAGFVDALSNFTPLAPAAIGATALIPTEASAGGGGKGGGHHGHWGHGHWGRHFGIVVIGPSCWRWIPGLGKVYVCY